MILVQQGEDDATVAYSSGCADSTCQWARPQTTRVRLRGGCSDVTIRFVDTGAAFMWLRVFGRATSEECRGAPTYPACNTAGRRLLTSAADDALAWAIMQTNTKDSVKLSDAWAGETAERMILSDSEGEGDGEGEGEERGRNSGGPRRVSGYDIEREAAGAGAEEPDAEAGVNDEEDDDRSDLDADVDVVCSVFKVLICQSMLPCEWLCGVPRLHFWPAL